MFDIDLKLLKKISGNGKIKVLRCEKDNRMKGRKFLVARIPIKKGDLITRKNITAKRSGGGLVPSIKNTEYFEGKRAKKDFDIDHIFKKRDVK